jgi:hypothetical protein
MKTLAAARAPRIVALRKIVSVQAPVSNRDAAALLVEWTPALVAGAPLAALTTSGSLCAVAVATLAGSLDAFDGLSGERKARVLAFAVSALVIGHRAYRPAGVDVSTWLEVLEAA